MAISEIADTDLSLGQLAYLSYLLVDFDFTDAYSRALPGKEIEVEDELYYQVDPEDAVEMLNEHFNPMQKTLTVYNTSFRQKQRPSGDGQYSDYGHSSSTTESAKDNNEPSDDDTTEETESSQTTDAESTETTQAPETDAPPEE